MRGPPLPLAPTKTQGPISIDLREKVELLSLNFFSPSVSRTLPVFCPKNVALFEFSPYLIHFFSFLKFGYMAHIAPCVNLLFGFVSSMKQFSSFQFNLFKMNLAQAIS